MAVEAENGDAFLISNIASLVHLILSLHDSLPVEYAVILAAHTGTNSDGLAAWYIQGSSTGV